MIRNSILFGLTAIIILVGLFLGLAVLPPSDYPANVIFTVHRGEGLAGLALDLKQENIIKSQFWFKTFSVLIGGLKGIKAGDYQLLEPESVISLAWRISEADYQLKPVRTTIPEGLNNFEISKILEKNIKNFDSKSFLSLAGTSEGYLFPDTYNFLPNIKAQEIVQELKDNFTQKIKTVEEQIKISGKSLSDIVKMASILELEARTDETRRIVAGILWTRLGLGMPLQVDSSFKYINGKGTKDLTLEDLKLNSPYNSYTNKGLPPTPISNPGLASIKAALTPIKTNYLYFLTDDEGNMHYAENYQKHLQNKSLYLK